MDTTGIRLLEHFIFTEERELYSSTLYRSGHLVTRWFWDRALPLVSEVVHRGKVVPGRGPGAILRLCLEARYLRQRRRSKRRQECPLLLRELSVSRIRLLKHSN
jgi:hypothetical protein